MPNHCVALPSKTGSRASLLDVKRSMVGRVNILQTWQLSGFSINILFVFQPSILNALVSRRPRTGLQAFPHLHLVYLKTSVEATKMPIVCSCPSTLHFQESSLLSLAPSSTVSPVRTCRCHLDELPLPSSGCYASRLSYRLRLVTGKAMEVRAHE
jgi:hypothetical protein